MGLSDTVKLKILSYCCGTELTAESFFTFSAFGIIHSTFWHFTTMQVKHTSKCLDDGPRGEISLTHLMPYETAQMEEILRLCFPGNLDARRASTALALQGVTAGCRPPAANATTQERKDLSSGDLLGGDTGSVGSSWVLRSPCLLCDVRAPRAVLGFAFDPG